MKYQQVNYDGFVRDLIMDGEGFGARVYPDSRNYPTIGYGYALVNTDGVRIVIQGRFDGLYGHKNMYDLAKTLIAEEAAKGDWFAMSMHRYYGPSDKTMEEAANRGEPRSMATFRIYGDDIDPNSGEDKPEANQSTFKVPGDDILMGLIAA